MLLVGCNAEEPQILGLQATVESLEQENERLKADIQSAMAERDAARNRMGELENLLNDCRRRLSERPIEAPTVSNIPQPVAPPTGGGADGIWTRQGNVALLTLQQDILFDAGRATLKAGAAGTIQQVAGALNGEFAGRLVLVIGHTDSDPIRKTKNLWEDNLDLSCNRAMTVVRELYRAGVPARSLIAAGQGEHNPRRDGSTNDDKRMNRRVEVVAINRG
ncbi:MAG: OmpA family protein [Phycisphaerae bacterium]|nr:OmpA family protein [Phycisphaerae bacterium]